jgi:diazepam-binding inhibitor (GABA receptor modulating acyl-CoA-binding protein)
MPDTSVLLQKLRSYGLFKQVEVGDVNTERPGFFNPVNRAKW